MANEITAISEENKVTQDLLLDYLKTMNKGLNEQQTKQFLAVAGTFGLNPWKREVYAVTFKNKDGSTDMSIVTGYETYIKRAELNPNYDGYEIEFKGSFKKGKVTKQGKNCSWQVDALLPVGEVSCVCTVYRKDRTHPIREEVFFDEYDKGNSMWQEKPRTMLKKCAIVSAFRKAFPFDFGGMPYTSEELPDNMTGSDKLEQQGYTEVSQDTLHTQKKVIDEETKNFLEKMEGLYNQSQEIYKKTMEEFGFEKALSIPVERRGEVYNTIVANITKAAQQPKSAPTAMEHHDNGEVDNNL